jgi:hypothetical protein
MCMPCQVLITINESRCMLLLLPAITNNSITSSTYPFTSVLLLHTLLKAGFYQQVIVGRNTISSERWLVYVNECYQMRHTIGG